MGALHIKDTSTLWTLQCGPVVSVTQRFHCRLLGKETEVESQVESQGTQDAQLSGYIAVLVNVISPITTKLYNLKKKNYISAINLVLTSADFWKVTC